MRSLIFLLLFSSQAFGALSIRDLDGDWSNGHEGVYDDVLDVTWLADANYAQTSGYDTNGRVDWYQAQSFASTLSIGSFDRLAATTSSLLKWLWMLTSSQ